MKNIKLNTTKLLLFTSLFCFFSSCEEYLDEDFRDGLSPSTFYNSDAEAEIAVMEPIQCLLMLVGINTEIG